MPNLGEGRPEQHRPQPVETRSERRTFRARITAAVLCAHLAIAAFVGIASAPGIMAADSPPPTSANGGGGPGTP
jgi:hypothetical protein